MILVGNVSFTFYCVTCNCDCFKKNKKKQKTVYFALEFKMNGLVMQEWLSFKCPKTLLCSYSIHQRLTHERFVLTVSGFSP